MMTTDYNVETYGSGLASIDEDGNRPVSRIGSSLNARALVQRLKTEDETRMWRQTKIMGLLDGNPPWSTQQLRDLGQGHRANFNLREGEGMVDAAKTPYYDLIFAVPQFAETTFDIPGVDPTLQGKWSGKLAEEYTNLLRNWFGFDQVMQLHQTQFVVNGVGPIFWPHSASWQSEALKSRKVLVPQETPANVDKLETVVVLHSWRADQLESYIRNSEANSGDHDGWNVEVSQQAIMRAALQETRASFGMENYDLYQRAIRTGDIYYGISRSNLIYVFSLFVREFGGKVSHYIASDAPLSSEEARLQERDITGGETGYIYKKKNKYDDFSQAICPFFFDVGTDGTWHSVKGLGPKIFDFCDISNRTFCQMLDGSVIGSGITLEAQDANSLEEQQVALVGGVTVVSPGYKVTQTRIAESLDGGMTVRRELQNVMQSNTGSYRARVAMENQEPTLGQAQMNWQQAAMLSQGATNRYINAMSRWHRETLRRLFDPAAQSKNVPGAEMAKMFIARCIMKGIPEEVLNIKNLINVTAIPSVGYGSPQVRDMATQSLMQMVPMMGEAGRNHALRARAAALPGVGQSQVDQYFPPIETAGVPDAHTALATLENNALRTIGGQAATEPNQNHSIHFDTHAKDLQAHDQDPNAHVTDKAVHFEQGGAHMAQHLNYIKGDPTRKQEVAQKQEQLDGIAKRTDQLHQQADEFAQGQIRAMPPPAQMSGEDQAKLAKVHGDLALKKEKQDADVALKAHKQAATISLADQKTAADIRRENMKAVNQPPPAQSTPTK